MDCNHARLLLNFARPRSAELEEGEAEALASHLARCPACATYEHAERRLDEHIGRAIRDVPLPDGLRRRLDLRLGRARDLWYRRRLLTWTGAAAAVLLAAFLSWNALRPRPAAINLDALVAQLNTVPINQETPTTPADVERWFRDRQIAMRAPGQFDYNLLANCQVADFQGQRVPLLVFQKARPDLKNLNPHDTRDAVAWVYVLDDRQFDLGSLEGKVPASFPTSALKIHWQRDPADPHTAYVIIYTGDGLEAFRKETRAT